MLGIKLEKALERKILWAATEPDLFVDSTRDSRRHFGRNSNSLKSDKIGRGSGLFSFLAFFAALARERKKKNTTPIGFAPYGDGTAA